MTQALHTPADLVAALDAACAPGERPRIEQRLGPDDETSGIRMRDLFDVARRAIDLPLEDVEHLLATSPRYEVRMAAVCVLDFRAKRTGRSAPTTAERARLAAIYLDHHDRITTWDMVDRAAPSVVGGHLMGASTAPLDALAATDDPLRRRTAVTAPLWFVRHGDDAAVAEGVRLAVALAGDADPVVHLACGTLLKHAGARDPEKVAELVREHGGSWPRPVVRSALAKLGPGTAGGP